MRTDLLKSLRDALYALPKDCPSFDLSVWAEDKLPESPALDCGTSACAIGLASTLPDWNDAGFTLVETHPGLYYPSLNGVDEGAFDVVAEFLGIDLGDSEFLFSPDEYEDDEKDGRVSPHVVADRISDFLKTA